MASKIKSKRPPSKKAVRAAADRAEAVSRGEEPKATPSPIDPPIMTAVEIKKAAEKTKRRRRRNIYTEPLGKALCKFLASGMTLNAVCRRPLMPAESTVRGWAVDPNHPFSARYVRAREIGYFQMADQIIDIADHSVNDYVTRLAKDGGVETVVNREVLERTRLRIDTRKWLLSKALPKMFGDKVEHGGKVTVEAASAPQPTGEDHLADMTRRYAAKVPAATVAPAGPRPNGKASSGLH